MKIISLYFTIAIFVLTSIRVSAQSWNYVGNHGISDAFGWYTSIAIAPGGTPYVAYSDLSVAGNSGGVTVKKYSDTGWVTVGMQGFSSAGTSNIAETITMAIDASGTPYVAFRDGADSNKASVMRYDGSSWVYLGSEGISEGTAIYTSIALNHAGMPYLAYIDYNGYKPTIMKYNSGWVPVGSGVADTASSMYTSLAIDGSGTPYVVYARPKANVKKFDGTNWVTVGSADFSVGNASYTSIAIDGSGTPYVAYVDGGNGYKVTVMKFDGTNWVAIGSGGFPNANASYTSIAIDSSGTPYVAYDYGYLYGKASVMKYDGANWVYVGSSSFTDSNAQYLSMAIDAGGTPYVSFTDWGVTKKATVMRFGWASGVPAINNGTTALYVFPDPTHNFFTLHLALPTKENVAITITNTLGEKIKQLTTTTNTDTPIQLDSPPGIYFISATTKQGSVNEKIILE